MPESISFKIFMWQGMDTTGKHCQGEIVGTEEKQVKDELSARNIFILKIKPKNFSLIHHVTKRITSQIIIDFTRQLLTLLQANLNLAVALQFIAKSQEHIYFRAIIRNVQQDVESGFSLDQALAKHPRYFSNFYCQLIYVGEQASSLKPILQEILTYLEKSARLKNKVKQALFYPIMVLIITACVISALLFFVVPQFQLMYSNFGASLPFYTQAIISFADGLPRYGWMLLITMALCVGVVWRYQCTPHGAYQLDRYRLKLPLLGNLIHQAILARLARTLGTALQSGLPLVDALHIIANSSGNLVFCRALTNMREHILAGQSLVQTMIPTQLFPERMLQLLTIAVETGSLSAMLTQLAEFYETQVELQVERLTRLLEPMLMLIIGILVGGLIIAMYLPIFRLGSVI